jgi:hypothetical protein
MASELEQKIEWCLTNADECERLAASRRDELDALIFRDLARQWRELAAKIEQFVANEQTQSEVTKCRTRRE